VIAYALRTYQTDPLTRPCEIPHTCC